MPKLKNLTILKTLAPLPAAQGKLLEKAAQRGAKEGPGIARVVPPYELVPSFNGWRRVARVNVAYGVATQNHNVVEVALNLPMTTKRRVALFSTWSGVTGFAKFQKGKVPGNPLVVIGAFLKMLQIVINAVVSAWTDFANTLMGSADGGGADDHVTKAHKTEDVVEDKKDQLVIEDPSSSPQNAGENAPISAASSVLASAYPADRAGVGVWVKNDAGKYTQILFGPKSKKQMMFRDPKEVDVAVALPPRVTHAAFRWLPRQVQKGRAEGGDCYGVMYIYEEI